MNPLALVTMGMQSYVADVILTYPLWGEMVIILEFDGA